MTKVWVAYRQDDQAAMQEIQLEVQEQALSCDIVMRALGKHLNPAEEWPFAVNHTDCSADADLCERAIRLNRSQAEKRYLNVSSVSYRPEGTVLQFTC